jgi:serine carboxypeptidase-like clade II
MYLLFKVIYSPKNLFIKSQVGNPVIDDQHDSFGTVEYWYSHGLISESTYNKLMDTCFDALDNSPSIMCIKAQEEAVAEFGNIDPYSIYTPPCNSTTSLKRRLRVHYVS